MFWDALVVWFVWNVFAPLMVIVGFALLYGIVVWRTSRKRG